MKGFLCAQMAGAPEAGKASPTGSMQTKLLTSLQVFSSLQRTDRCKTAFSVHPPPGVVSVH